MANPGEVLRQAARGRERLSQETRASMARETQPQAMGSSVEDGLNRGRMPAGIGKQAVEPAARGMQSARNAVRETQTSLRASHANYSALMRSHDRVRTCHLNPH